MKFGNRSCVLVLVVIAILLSALPSRVSAQRGYAFAQIEGGIGVGATKANYHEPEGLSAEIVVGYVSPRQTGRTVSLFASGQGAPSTGGDCSGPPTTPTQIVCREHFPFFWSFGALLGRTWAAGRALSLTFSAGPSIHHGDGGGTAFGVSARSQASVHVAEPVSITLAIKASGLPSYRGDAVGLTAFGVGVAFRR